MQEALERKEKAQFDFGDEFGNIPDEGPYEQKVEEVSRTVEELKIPYTNVRAGGMGFVTERGLKLRNPIEGYRTVGASIKDIYPEWKTDEDMQKGIKNITFWVDKNGTKYPVDPALTVEGVLNFGDSVGAEKYIRKGQNPDDETAWRNNILLWEKVIANRTTIPPGVVTAVEFADSEKGQKEGLTPIDPYGPRALNRVFGEFAFDVETEGSSENMAVLKRGHYYLNSFAFMPQRLFGDSGLPNALMAMHVDDKLRARGVSPRDRAILIEERLGELFYGDIERMIRNPYDTVVKGSASLGLYLAGEFLDTMDEIFETPLDLTGIIPQNEAYPSALITPSKGFLRDPGSRQNVIEFIFGPDLAFSLQERAKKAGVDLPLREAELIAQTYSGIPSKGFSLYLEFKIPTSLLNKYKWASSQKELQRFKRWTENEYKKTGTDKDFDLGELMAAYALVRPQVVAAEKGLDVTKTASPKQQAKYMKRIQQGIQIIDSQIENVDERAAVVQVQEALAQSYARLDSLKAQASRTGPTVKSVKELEKAKTAIENGHVALNNAKRRSSKPQWVVDDNVQDQYLLGGAITVNALAEALDLNDNNPELIDLFGIGAGAVLVFSKGNLRNASEYIKLKYAGATLFGRKKEDFRAQLEVYLNRIFRANPDVQLRYNQRSKIMKGLQDEILETGEIDEDLVYMTLPVLSDYAALRQIQQTAVDSISVNQGKDLNFVNALQSNLDAQAVLHKQLKEMLIGFEDTGVDNALVNIVRAAEQDARENIGQLNKTLNVIKEEGVQFYLNAAKQNTKGMIEERSPSTLEPSQTISFPDAMVQLFVGGMLDSSAIPADEFASVIARGEDAILRNVMTIQRTVFSKLGTVDNIKRLAQDNIPTYKDTDIINIDTAGGGLAYHLEVKHVSDNLAARRILMMLDPANNRGNRKLTYRVKGMNADMPDGVVPQVDVYDLFENILLTDTLFPGTEITAIRALRGDEILTAGQKIKTKTIVKDLTDPFFLRLANEGGLEPEEVIPAMAAEFGISTKGKSKLDLQFEVAARLLKDENTSFFKMTPDELIEFDRTIRSLAYNNKNKFSQSRLLETANLVDSKFEEFTIDGRLVDEVEVFYPDTNSFVPLRQLLNMGKEDYRRYKEVYFDDVNKSSLYGNAAILPKLMSWNKRVIQSEGGSAANPTGIGYEINAREWLSPNVIDQMLKEPDQARLFFDAMRNSLGSRSDFVSGTAHTDLFVQTMKTAIAEYLAQRGVKGDINTFEQRQAFDTLQKIFVMTDGGTGQTIPMFRVGEVIEDAFGKSSQTIGKDRQAVIDKNAEESIKSAIDAAKLPAEKVREGLQDSITLLQEFGVGKMKIGEVGDALIDFGPSRLADFKAALMEIRDSKITTKSKYTAQEVDEIIREAVINAISRQSFINTDKTKIDGGRQFSQQIVNLSSMQKILGIADNNVERQQFLTQILGEKKWNHFRATSKFLAELENDPIAYRMGITGVPRGFSVESIISRIYAVNRGVIRPQYVGTEAVLQQLRKQGYNLEAAMLNNVELGQMIMEIVSTGKPLNEVQNIEFQRLLLQSGAQMLNVYPLNDKVITDQFGRKIEVRTHKE